MTSKYHSKGALGAMLEQLDGLRQQTAEESARTCNRFGASLVMERVTPLRGVRTKLACGEVVVNLYENGFQITMAKGGELIFIGSPEETMQHLADNLRA